MKSKSPLSDGKSFNQKQTKEISTTPNSKDASISSPAKNKQLSGAVLGMRFMQRKAQEANRLEKDTKECVEQAESESEIPRPIIASVADMYGVEADIIGRRSFGGFNKAVGETWQVAYNSRQKRKKDSQSNRVTLTDEEVLRRYKQYIQA